MKNKPISLEELKQIELDILLYFKKICEDNNLRYSLSYGTLLGAVRHGGFIPWDDDIDVQMPREDYNRLIQYFQNNNTKYKLVSIETDESYGYLFAKLINPKTIIIENHSNRNNSDIGVFIDIFPLDGVGNTYKEVKTTFSKNRFLRAILVASNWKHFFLSKTHKWYYNPIRFALFIISRFYNPNKLAKAIRKKQNISCSPNSTYFLVLSSPFKIVELFDKEKLFKYTTVNFEGNSFKAYRDYDNYLRMLYGDYMKLPAEDKRATHHMFDAYWRD